MFVQCRLRKLQQAEKLSMPIQGLQWVPRQGFAFPEKKRLKTHKKYLVKLQKRLHKDTAYCVYSPKIAEKRQEAEKLSMPIQGLQWGLRQGFAFPEK